MFEFLKRLFTRAPKGPEIPPESMPILREGDHGPQVERLQKYLKAEGFFPGKPGGNFGPQTLSGLVAFQHANTGPDGSRLKVTGTSTAETWWALFNDPPALEPAPEPTRMRNYGSSARAAVVGVCLAFLKQNIKERPNGSNTGPGVAQFHKWFGLPPLAWCAMAATRVYFDALGAIPWGKKEAGVANLFALAKTKGMARGLNYLPAPGDAYVIVHSDGTGHIGIIVAVSEDYKIFEVAEGNSGNAFRKVTRYARATDHVGYITPFKEAISPVFTMGLFGNAEIPQGTR